MFIRSLRFVVILCLVARAAAAQAPPPDADQPPPPGTGGFSTNGKTLWQRSISIGGQFTSAPFEQGPLTPAVPGLTGALVGLPGNQHAAQGSISLFRAAKLHALDIEASYTYAVVQPTGTVQDLPKASVDYSWRHKEQQHYYLLARYAWYKDSVRQVDYSHQALIGIGLSPVHTKKVTLSVAPVVGVLYEHKDVPAFDDRLLTGWGALERIVYTPNPFVQVEQRIGYVEAFNDADFRIIDASFGFKGKLTRNLALTFNLTHKYDNVEAQARTALPIPGVGTVFVQATNRTQITTIAGLQITF